MLMDVICFIFQTLHDLLVPKLQLKRDEYGGPENTLKIFGYAIDKLDSMKESRPFIHGLIFEDNKYRYCKGFIGFVFGTFVGMAFYEYILSGLKISKDTMYFLGKMSTLLLAIGCMVFTQIRCLVLICLPTFFGSAGRHIFQALILTAVISGPVRNVILNFEEAQRMVSCSNRMAYNLSQARYGLLVKPFKLAFLGTKIETEELKDTLASVKNVVEPLAQEIEGKDDTKYIKEENDYLDAELGDTKRSEEMANKYSYEEKKHFPFVPFVVNINLTENLSSVAEKYQNKYYEKLELRCEGVKTSMTKSCHSAFHNLYDRCMDTFHWTFNWAICWAVKLTFICDLVRMFSYGSYDCDPSTAVSGSMGTKYASILQTGAKLKAKVAKEKTQYKIHEPPNFVSLRSVITIIKEFHHDMLYANEVVTLSVKLLRAILAFLFIWVIINAQSYHDKFVQEPAHDNNYITAQFRTLDAQRHLEGKKTVLPLMKLERSETVDPYSPFLQQVEIDEEWLELREMFILAQRFPSCTLFRLVPWSRAACCICMEAEVKNPLPIEKYTYCEHCKIFYCPECWLNFSHTCIVCHALARKDKLVEKGKRDASHLSLPQGLNPPSASGSGLPPGGNPPSTSGSGLPPGGNLPSTSGSGLPK
ncbi:protein sneaky isoform X3 [Homalodisca vitripennis]|uniref:protein sneaky isoform X3 n=1 Tax=Homalodisca vitripennis TaxID=197043 RepID=UPI001EECDD3B|nr:protein sneaky isoform X3 [Homalodisca vitripennis]